jgi:CxxC motif-containing protein (DUF1111 family)
MSLTLIRRTIPKIIMNLACGVLGICETAVMLAGCVKVDADPPARAPQAAPQDLAMDLPDEAPTGFDNLTNGFEDQTAFSNDRTKFEEVEAIADGLGPVYNATSCVSCHQNPVSGSSSQVAEVRAGHHEPDPKDPRKVIFIEPPGGSLIHQRAIDAAIQEHVPAEDEVRTLRMSTNILGNGFVEVIPDEDILKLRAAQPAGIRGLPVAVPVAVAAKKTVGGAIEFDFVERIGRFGWKCQEASLLNFSAGAYLNEMGITNPLNPKENTSNGRDVTPFDHVPDPEDQTVDPNDPSKVEHLFGVDVESFTRFLRATKAPPKDSSQAGTNDVQEGEKLFRNNEALGCAICHHPDYTTPKAGTPIKPLYSDSMPGPGSDLGVVPKELGNKIIHPYSDFLLHDIGTGDGIAQTQHGQRPPRGVEKLRKIPDDIAARAGIARVQAGAGLRDQRVLCDTPGLDQRTINRIRTAPLWGLRVRPQLLHDGSALTIDEAIRRHKGQAEEVTKKYLKLVEEHPEQARQLLAFLNSL